MSWASKAAQILSMLGPAAKKDMHDAAATEVVELLRKHIQQVKTGLPGMAYVRLDTGADWPARLRDGLVQ